MQSRCCFFEPESKTRTRWDLVQVPLLIATALIVPLRVGFSINVEPFDPYFFFDVFTDAYFLIDIVLNFRTAYYDARGNLIFIRREIAWNYVKGWLLVDVLSCLPINYIMYIVDAFKDSSLSDSGDIDTAPLKMAKILRLFRLAKMLRLLVSLSNRHCARLTDRCPPQQHSLTCSFLL
eukprot:SAG31_NODE_2053_length_6551_cov_7.496125_2_plen_178_part_00